MINNIPKMMVRILHLIPVITTDLHEISQTSEDIHTNTSRGFFILFFVSFLFNSCLDQKYESNEIPPKKQEKNNNRRLKICGNRTSNK